MSYKGSKAEDKRAQWWASIAKEKLDALRWVMLHSGLNVATMQSDDGLTGIQIAAGTDKPKALLVILDILRQKRELAEAVDVRTDDARGCRCARARRARRAPPRARNSAARHPARLRRRRRRRRLAARCTSPARAARKSARSI